MAIVDGLSFTQNDDISTGVVTDTSNYGIGGNPARNAAANFLLWSKTDASGNRVFTNPDQGDILNTLLYTVATTVDGYYEGILLRVSPYAGGTPYVPQQSSGSTITQYASVVYVGTTVYINILAVTGISPTAPSGPTYWQVVSDLSTIIGNPNIHTFVKAFYLRPRSMSCAGKQFISCGCGCNGDLDIIRTPLLIVSKIMAADSEFANNNYTAMQKIIGEVSDICSTCGS